jgi:hypothetical protein
MDWEPHDPQRPYRACRRGFALLAIGLGLLCLTDLASLAFAFGLFPAYGHLRDLQLWTWAVDFPITATTLLGALTLLQCWPVASWNRRVALLAFMNGIDFVTWVLTRSEEIGVTIAPGVEAHAWLIQLMTLGLGWFELMLAASLAADVSAHLWNTSAGAAGRGVQVTALIGAVLWAVIVVTRTDWEVWPIAPAPRGPDLALLLLLQTLLQGIAAFQLTALCLHASRQCSEHIQQWEQRETLHDPLRSRSETEGDEIQWK